ncbi:M48 family peptidase [Candidatus Woesearchaeota archaeon]|nr:MAG: M48 family peptidase [Candidatus Woesearchaeota archaeon]
MNLLEKAYLQLTGEAYCPYTCYVEYSGRFKDFGANIELRQSKLKVKLSRAWYGKPEEVQIGCIQELLCRLLGVSSTTTQIEQYHHFIKNVHNGIVKRRAEPELLASFNRVNERFFVGLVERPNLVWGRESYRTFGSYCFKTDTIRISKVLRTVDPELLDYVMYHEMLHKVHKFRRAGRKILYHDRKFQQAESIYPEQEKMERALGVIAAKARSKSFLTGKKWF